MDGWDIALLAIGGFVAATALVRLMIHRRNELVRQLLLESQQRPKGAQPAPGKEGPTGPARTP